MQKLIAVFSILLLCSSTLVLPAMAYGQRQPPDKIKALVASVGNRPVEASLPDGRKIVGKTGEATAEDFVITDAKTGARTRLAYADVSQVRKLGLSKGTKIAIGVGIGLAAIVTLVLVLGRRANLGNIHM